MMADHTIELPRDQFSSMRRACNDNPGALKASSTLQIDDMYGNSETWVVDTIRLEPERVVVFLQRSSSEAPLRIVLPVTVTKAIARHREQLAGRVRQQGARKAVETRRLRGDTLGNADALRKARAHDPASCTIDDCSRCGEYFNRLRRQLATRKKKAAK